MTLIKGTSNAQSNRVSLITPLKSADASIFTQKSVITNEMRVNRFVNLLPHNRFFLSYKICIYTTVSHTLVATFLIKGAHLWMIMLTFIVIVTLKWSVLCSRQAASFRLIRSISFGMGSLPGPRDKRYRGDGPGTPLWRRC